MDYYVFFRSLSHQQHSRCPTPFCFRPYLEDNLDIIYDDILHVENNHAEVGFSPRGIERLREVLQLFEENFMARLKRLAIVHRDHMQRFIDERL